MNSKECLSIEGTRYAAISTKALEAAIRKGTEIGTKAAIEYIEKQRQMETKNRYDRMLHNTRLLLEKYRVLKKHTEGAIYSSNQVKENAIDILDSLDAQLLSNGVYIKSIKQSQQRTLVIIRHIDKMLDVYRVLCEQDKDKPEAKRRYNTIYNRYIADEQMSIPEIAACNHTGERAVYNDISAGIKTLSALIFGVYGAYVE